MDYNEAIKTIIGLDMEDSAIRKLLDSLKMKSLDGAFSRNEMRASLRAIKKLNKGKNEAIDALCEI